MATSRKHGARTPLATDCSFEGTRPLEEILRRRVVGQDDAMNSVVCSYSRLLSGLRDPNRPLLTMFLLGPTGVGKTETARSLSEALFESDQALTRINCEEFAHSHEVAKLLGSPPGYVGHGTEPLLSQKRIDNSARKRKNDEEEQESPPRRGLADQIVGVNREHPVSLVLFDEIEKADPAVWNALLGIIEEGELTLGDNSTTDFRNSIIIMTSNVGSHEMNEILERKVGFDVPHEERHSDAAAIQEAAMTAARKTFPLEFLNRFDEILVYKPLGHDDLEKILENLLQEIHKRTMEQAQVPLLLQVSPEAREQILQHGTDPRFGARPLRRAVEREIVDPLSRLIASHRLQPGDIVEIETDGDNLQFFRSMTAAVAV